MNMDSVVMLFTLGAALAFGAWIRSIAVSKGYPGRFFWLGFILQLFGVIIAACLPGKSSQLGRFPSAAFNHASSESVSSGSDQHGNTIPVPEASAELVSGHPEMGNTPGKVISDDG